jgi:hypothetical protein
MLGLLADLPRKNCWTIAEHAGDATPDGMHASSQVRGAFREPETSAMGNAG